MEKEFQKIGKMAREGVRPWESDGPIDNKSAFAWGVTHEGQRELTEYAVSAYREALKVTSNPSEAWDKAERVVELYKKKKRNEGLEYVNNTMNAFSADELIELSSEVPYKVIDLRSKSPEFVFKFFKKIVDGDIVLHGARRQDPYESLNPTFSKSGEKPKAIFATDDPRVALINAVIKIPPQIRKIDMGVGFAAAMDVKGKKVIFESPPATYEYLKNHDVEEVSSEGLVYVLPKIDFDRSWHVDESSVSDHEYNTQSEVVPFAAIRVPGDLAKQLLVLGEGDEDTIYQYPKEEFEKMTKEYFSPEDYVRKVLDKILPTEETVNGLLFIEKLTDYADLKEKLMKKENQPILSKIREIKDDLPRELFIKKLVNIMGIGNSE